MNESWTTSLGRQLQELQANGAPDQELFALEHKLQIAFGCVKHVRRCYNKPSAQEVQ